MSAYDFEPVEPMVYILGRDERMRDSALQAGKTVVFMQVYCQEISQEYIGKSLALIRHSQPDGDELEITFSMSPKHRAQVDKYPNIGKFKDGLWQPDPQKKLTLHGLPLDEGYFQMPTEEELRDEQRRIDDHAMKSRLETIVNEAH